MKKNNSTPSSRRSNFDNHPSSFKDLRILVVDDYANFLETTIDLLEGKGFHCVGTTSGLEAIDKVKEMRFDAILMDIRMPRLNGIETYRMIKKIRPDTMVILMTAFKVNDLIREAHREGVHAILKKPLDLEIVTDMIVRGKEE